MLWYENIKPTIIYDNVKTLLLENPELYNKESIVFYVNQEGGFGCQLTLLVRYGLYFKSINPKIHCLGCFCVNGNSFKYHDEAYNNSFFLYFKYTKQIDTRVNCYFLRDTYNDVIYPFIQPQDTDGLNVDCIDINIKYSDFFKQHFRLKIGDDIINNIKSLKDSTKKPLIGIHIRSILQIVAHPFGRDINIIDKLQKIKANLDAKYDCQYDIFFVTDVSDYINIIVNLFNGTNVQIYYNNFISRINNHVGEKYTGHGGYNDSVINLEEYKGFKLGSDIIYDCLSLIHCDSYFVSVTNVAFITSFLSDNDNGIHFN